MYDKGNQIRYFNAYDKDAYTFYPVLIIGAGESGIALGCRLKEVLGFDQFRIFDRQAGPGGTCESPLNSDPIFRLSFRTHMPRHVFLPLKKYVADST